MIFSQGKLLIVFLTLSSYSWGPHSPMVEATDLKSVQCGFESHWGHLMAVIEDGSVPRAVNVHSMSSRPPHGPAWGPLPTRSCGTAAGGVSVCEALELGPWTRAGSTGSPGSAAAARARCAPGRSIAASRSVPGMPGRRSRWTATGWRTVRWPDHPSR